MSGLKIATREKDGVLVLDLNGKIGLGETNNVLHETLKQAVQDGHRKIVANLGSVTGIDSSGLGELIAGYATLEKNGGTMKLADISPRVTELMTITKLLTVFDVFDTVEDAAASFDGGQAEAASQQG